MRRERDITDTAGRVVQFLFALILVVMICLSFVGCGTVKEIPVQTIEKVVVRDSLVYITDTVTVKIPKEVIKEIVPADTASILRTSVALSEARVEKGMLHHSLEQRGSVKTQIDTVIKVQYVDRIVEKEVPIEVEVIKYKRDSIYWFSIILNIVGILLILFRLYLKFRA